MLSVDESLAVVVETSGILAAALDHLRSDWQPERPPITLEFSTIGSKFARHFREFSEVEKRKFFEAVERIMREGDDVASTGVATGLLEAILSRTDDDIATQKELMAYMGQKSRHHCDAWNNFYKKS